MSIQSGQVAEIQWGALTHTQKVRSKAIRAYVRKINVGDHGISAKWREERTKRPESDRVN